ncbi:hypothetical protein ILYODFUR_039194 [Ilyodon furcidens]|uniref:Uncharacterized protein n=1 Tax=Ilyodon furcidens TaxID=33524 RepID=A0ABV0TQK0_9TELE
MASCHVCSRSHSDGWPGDDSVQDGWRGSCGTVVRPDASTSKMTVKSALTWFRCGENIMNNFKLHKERFSLSNSNLISDGTRFCTAQKTPVWSIPQVNRYIGNR